MDPNTAAPADSATAEVSFSEYEATQNAAKSEAPPSVPDSKESLEKAAPDSEPVKGKEQKHVLTDDEKSAMKTANTERRMTRLNRELGAAQAEIARLAKTAAPPESATGKPAAKPAAEDPSDPKPKVGDYHGKESAPGADDGFFMFTEDLAAWTTRHTFGELTAKQQEAANKKAADAAGETFVEKIKGFIDEHEDFMEKYNLVSAALEESMPAVSRAIAAHPKSAEIIDFLGSDEGVELDLLGQLTQSAAIKEIAKIGRTFDAPVPQEPKPKSPTLPRAPARVRGSGHAPTLDDVQTEAAEKNDFASYEMAENRRLGRK